MEYEVMYPFEGGIDTIEIQDIEEILSDNPRQPTPAQTDPSQSVEKAYAFD